MDDTKKITIAITPAQLRRVQQLTQAAIEMTNRRNDVISAIVEHEMDADLTKYAIQLTDTAIVLSPISSIPAPPS